MTGGSLCPNVGYRHQQHSVHCTISDILPRRPNMASIEHPMAATTPSPFTLPIKRISTDNSSDDLRSHAQHPRQPNLQTRSNHRRDPLDRAEDSLCNRYLLHRVLQSQKKGCGTNHAERIQSFAMIAEMLAREVPEAGPEGEGFCGENAGTLL